MRVTFKINDKTYSYPSLQSKRKVGGVISRLQREVGILEGSCSVSYTQKFKNEFEFSGVDDLKHKLMPCLEPELIKEFA